MDRVSARREIWITSVNDFFLVPKEYGSFYTVVGQGVQRLRYNAFTAFAEEGSLVELTDVQRRMLSSMMSLSTDQQEALLDFLEKI